MVKIGVSVIVLSFCLEPIVMMLLNNGYDSLPVRKVAFQPPTRYF